MEVKSRILNGMLTLRHGANLDYAAFRIVTVVNLTWLVVNLHILLVDRNEQAIGVSDWVDSDITAEHLSCNTLNTTSGIAVTGTDDEFRLEELRNSIVNLQTCLVELIKANVAMARIVLSPGLDGYKPGVIRIPAAKNIRSLYGLDMVANSITLTPGTITMEVAEDTQGDNYFYVQWASVEETDREKAGDIIKGRMENWIGRIWR